MIYYICVCTSIPRAPQASRRWKKGTLTRVGSLAPAVCDMFMCICTCIAQELLKPRRRWKKGTSTRVGSLAPAASLKNRSLSVNCLWTTC